MFKEHELAGSLVELFASYPRQSDACKVGFGEILIGAVQTVKGKIIEMNHLYKTFYCVSMACACEGHRKP